MPLIDLWPDLPAPSTTSLGLNYLFDILPDDYLSEMRFLWTPRVKVGSTEVQIQGEATLSESESEIGETVEFTLLNPADKSLFTSSAVIEFGFGKIVAGVWDTASFITLLDNAVVDKLEYNITGPPNDPKDRVKVTIIGKGADKLAKTSQRGLIIYDSARTTVSPADLTPLVDDAGVTYLPEIIGRAGLTFGYLLNEILVTKCGFTNVHTDLPVNDWPIQRYEVKMGQRYFDGLKGFLGCYTPAIYPRGDDIWITDTTKLQPAGFPAARRITLDRPLSINANSERQKLDAYKVQFSGLENNYDYTTFLYEYPIGGKGNTRTEEERISIEFRKKTSPITNVIVRTALNIDNKRTFLSGTEIDSSNEVFEFDNKGRISHHRNSSEKLVPDYGSGFTINSLQTVERMSEEYEYSAHPFQPRKDYVARRSYRTDGLCYVDSVNPRPDGSDFVMPVVDAQRGGNITDAGAYADRTLKSGEEAADPLRDGTVRVRIREVDEVTGLVIRDTTEDRSGDVAVAGSATGSGDILVYKVRGASRTAERVEDFSIGELPLKYGIPLARRKLLQRQADFGGVNIPILAYDEFLVKGSSIAPFDRDGNSLGTFLITGRRLNFNAEGLILNLTGRVMAASTQSLQELGSYSTTINESTSLTFAMPIDCTADYFLRLDPTTVADLTIEARHVELPALGWTDLEAGNLDLTAWDGTTEDFEVRVTAGAVSVTTRREFTLEVEKLV